jgi:putative endonuclease
VREIVERGKRGEEAARLALVAKRYRILDANFRVRGGELDIVAESPEGVTVFIEVRSLRRQASIDPSETIDRRKISRLLHAARIYLTVRGRLTKPFRFDFIGIRGEGAGATVDHRISVLRQEDLEHGLF